MVVDLVKTHTININDTEDADYSLDDDNDESWSHVSVSQVLTGADLEWRRPGQNTLYRTQHPPGGTVSSTVLSCNQSRTS